jgi:uncharacterized membrane protein
MTLITFAILAIIIIVIIIIIIFIHSSFVIQSQHRHHHHHHIHSFVIRHSIATSQIYIGEDNEEREDQGTG